MLSRKSFSLCSSRLIKVNQTSCACYKSPAVNVFTGVHKEVATPGSSYEQCLPVDKIPGPGGVPWFGRWLEYKLDYSKIHRRDRVLKKLQSEYGDIVKETIAGRHIVHLFHADYIRQVYESEGKYPLIPPIMESVEFYRRKKDLTPGLGNSNGEEWYKLRSAVQYILLRPHKAKDFLTGQNRVAAEFMEKFDTVIGENGEVDNLNRWIARFGLESAANNCFDVRMNYFASDEGMRKGDAIIDANREIFELTTKLYFSLPLYRLFPLPSIKKLFEREDLINDRANEMLDDALDRYKTAIDTGALTDDRFLFLTHMLQSEKVSEKDLRTIVLSILTDTLSTTSQILLYNMYNLAQNPDAQEKAAEEAQELLSSSGEFTHDAFNRSVYIKACIKESFRIMPVGLDILRLSPCDLAIGGYQVPKGTYLCLNNYVHSNDPEKFPQADKYIPERWLRDSDDKINPYLLTPFSLGTRMCVGRRLAEHELMLMLCKILTRYRLEWHHEPIVQHFQMLMVPNRKVDIKFIRRQK